MADNTVPTTPSNGSSEWTAAMALIPKKSTGHTWRRHATTTTAPKTASHSRTVASKSGPAVKEVRYWAAEVTGGDGGLVHEVDEVAWLEADAARATLTYPHDLAQLDALVAADAQGSLTTWPLAVLRHAKARPRASWTDDDWLRPLDDQGRTQAADLVPLLAGYGIERLVSSPSTRASDTLAPYATASGGRLRLKPGLSEEGYAEDMRIAQETRDLNVLQHQQAVLVAEVDHLHGPQNLQEQAEKLGMRPNPYGSYIDLRTGKVIGTQTKVDGKEVPGVIGKTAKPKVGQP